jgi:hypothetical protein
MSGAPSYGAGPTNTGFLGQSGNLGGGPAPATYASTNNVFSPYFGEPLRDIGKTMNPYSAYGRENYALPDAYKGPNGYMTQILIHVIQNEDLWPTKVVLPIRITESEMEIQWDEYIFNNHLLGPVPEEGISRLVTQQTNERRDHYVRYGIAFILEHGFMKTPKGQTSYRMNLEQIRNATLESMYFGVVEALLRSKQYSQAWIRKYGTQSRSGSALRGILGEEVERYFCIQKSEHGFDMLDNKAKKYLKSNGVTPDTWVVPEGMFSYLSLVRPENRDYFLKGPQGPADYNSALQNGVPAMQTRNGCNVFESKSFEIPNAPGPIDPMSREVSVGEYVTMQDTISDVVGPAKYKSFMRDIFIYNEGRDDFSRISLKHALAGCCRFTSTGDELYFPSDFKSNSTVNDMFLMGMGRPAYVFGDMHEEYLNNDTLYKLGASLVSSIKAAFTPVELTTLKEMAGKKYADVDGDDKKLLKKFFDLLQGIIPTSRIFDKMYMPEWDTTDNKFVHGCFINTFGKTEYAYRTVAAGGALAPIVLPDVDSINFKAGNANVFNAAGSVVWGDESKVWTAIRDYLYKLVSTKESMDDVSDAEKALNNGSVDKIMHRLQEFKTVLSGWNGLHAYLSVLAALRAECVTAGTVKHFAYFVHKLYEDFGMVGVEITPGAGGAPAVIFTTFKREVNMIVSIAQNAASIDAFKTAVISSATLVKTYIMDTRAAARVAVAGGDVDDAFVPGDEQQSETFEIFPTNIGPDFVQEWNKKLRAFGNRALRRKPTTALGMDGRFGALRTDDRREPEGFFSRRGDDDFPEDPDKVASTNLKNRFDEIYGDTNRDALERAAILAFLQMPITNRALGQLIEKDIFFPFEFILFRPTITHNMSTAVLLKAGSETGETLIGHCDFQLADDVVRKMHYGNFTLYSKSIVYKSDNVYLAENIMATGYVRGNDAGINTLTSLRNEMELPKSIYAALVPIMSTSGDSAPTAGGYANPMDVTGRFATQIPHLARLDEEIGNTRNLLHYPCADFYSSVYRFNNSAQTMTAEFEYQQVNRYNTLCFQGHQATYNPNNGMFDLVTINTGHFGPRVYAGAGKVRRGDQKFLEPVSYTSEFGAKNNMVSLGA